MCTFHKLSALSSANIHNSCENQVTRGRGDWGKELAKSIAQTLPESYKLFYNKYAQYMRRMIQSAFSIIADPLYSKKR